MPTFFPKERVLKISVELLLLLGGMVLFLALNGRFAGMARGDILVFLQEQKLVFFAAIPSFCLVRVLYPLIPSLPPATKVWDLLAHTFFFVLGLALVFAMILLGDKKSEHFDRFLLAVFASFAFFLGIFFFASLKVLFTRAAKRLGVADLGISLLGVGASYAAAYGLMSVISRPTFLLSPSAFVPFSLVAFALFLLLSFERARHMYFRWIFSPAPQFLLMICLTFVLRFYSYIEWPAW